MVYTDIKPDSYTFYIDPCIERGPMKRFLTSTYTRRPATKAAAVPAKQRANHGPPEKASGGYGVTT